MVNAAVAVAAAAGYDLMLPSKIRKWEAFTGQDVDWLGWSFATNSALQQLGWQPLLGAARASPTPLGEVTVGPAVTSVSRNLYALFAQKTRCKAQTCTRLLAHSSNVFGSMALFLLRVPARWR